MKEVLQWFLSAETFIYPCLVVFAWLVFVFVRLNANDQWAAVTIIFYCITDLTGSVMAHNSVNNLWFYNLMLFPQFLLITVTLTMNLENRLLRWILLFGFVAIILLHTLNLYFYQGLYEFDSFSYIPAMAWMAVCAFFCLRDQVHDIEFSPFSKFLSWFALAVLIDNAGSMPILSILGWSAYIHTEQAARLMEVVTVLYVLWYMIILSGLIWTRILRRSVSRYQ